MAENDMATLINGFLKPRHPILGQELAGEVRETKILSLF